MPLATAPKIELPQEQLAELFSSLDRHEKEHLALQLLDIIRQDVVDLEAMKELLENWRMTAAVRHHPHFEPQLKEYTRLLESGEIFDGMGFDESTIQELRANANLA